MRKSRTGKARLCGALAAAVMLASLFALPAAGQEMPVEESFPIGEDTSAVVTDSSLVETVDEQESELSSSQSEVETHPQTSVASDVEITSEVTTSEEDTLEDRQAVNLLMDSVGFDIPENVTHSVNSLQGFTDALAAIDLLGEGHIFLESDITLTGTISIPTGADVSITSDPAAPKSILMDDACINQRHFTVADATLRLADVKVVGRLSQNLAAQAGTGGVDVSNGTLELYDGAAVTQCSVSGQTNLASKQGGGIRAANNSTITLFGGEVSYNEIAVHTVDETLSGNANGGGIYISGPQSTLNIYDGASIHNNRISCTNKGLEITGTYGAGVYANATDINMYGGEVYENRGSSYGGGFSIYGTSPSSTPTYTMEIYGGSIRNNYAVQRGGGIYNQYGVTINMHDGAISYNEAMFRGGGIYVLQHATLNILGGELTHNKAAVNVAPGVSGYGGGAIFIEGYGSRDWEQLNIQNANLSYNTTSCFGGAVYVGYTISKATISNSRFVGNTAGLDGGAIYFYFANTLTHAQAYVDRLAVDNTWFNSNYAGNGAMEFDYTDTALYGWHTDNINVTSLSAPFDPTLEDSSGLNMAFNNFDIRYTDNNPVSTHKVEFYLDGSLWVTGAAAAGQPVQDPSHLFSIPGKVLYGWYKAADFSGPKWDFEDGVTAPMQLHAKYGDPEYTITIEYYKDSLSSTAIATEYIYNVPKGDDAATHLPTGWLNTHKPAAGYQNGVLADPVSLPGAIIADTLLKVLYEPVPEYTITVEYYRDSLSSTAIATEYVHNVPEGNDPAAHLPTGWLNTHKPAGYQDGVLATPTSLPGTIMADTLLKVLYNPVPPVPTVYSDVVFYYNYGEYGTTAEYLRYTNIAEGSILTRPASPTREGYALARWTTDAAGRNTWNFTANTTPGATLHLYAQWSREQYRVTFDYSSVRSQNRQEYYQVYYGDPLPQPGTTIPGYRFLGWQHNDGYWDMENGTMPAQDITLMGAWRVRSGGTNPPAESASSTTTSYVVTTSASSSSSSSSSESENGEAAVASEAPAPSSTVPTPTSEAPAVSSTPPDTVTTETQSFQIFGYEIPIGGFAKQGGWSLSNLLLVLLVLASALFQLARFLLAGKRRSALGTTDLENSSKTTGATVWSILAMASGILPLLLWLVLEDFGAQTLLVNNWTPFFLVVAAAHTVIATVASVMKKKTLS